MITLTSVTSADGDGCQLVGGCAEPTGGIYEVALQRPMPTPRHAAAASLSTEGELFVAGGSSSSELKGMPVVESMDTAVPGSGWKTQQPLPAVQD